MRISKWKGREERKLRLICGCCWNNKTHSDKETIIFFPRTSIFFLRSKPPNFNLYVYILCAERMNVISPPNFQQHLRGVMHATVIRESQTNNGPRRNYSGALHVVVTLCVFCRINTTQYNKISLAFTTMIVAIVCIFWRWKIIMQVKVKNIYAICKVRSLKMFILCSKIKVAKKKEATNTRNISNVEGISPRNQILSILFSISIFQHITHLTAGTWWQLRSFFAKCSLAIFSWAKLSYICATGQYLSIINSAHIANQ